MRFDLPPVRRPQSPLARVLTAVVALIVLGLSIVLGTIALGVLVVGGLIWLVWFRWKLHRLRKQATQRAADGDGVIEGEYVVVHERRDTATRVD